MTRTRSEDIVCKRSGTASGYLIAALELDGRWSWSRNKFTPTVTVIPGPAFPLASQRLSPVSIYHGHTHANAVSGYFSKLPTSSASSQPSLCFIPQLRPCTLSTSRTALCIGVLGTMLGLE